MLTRLIAHGETVGETGVEYEYRCAEHEHEHE